MASAPTRPSPVSGRADRVRSGCVGAVLYFPFFLLLIILGLPLSNLIGDRAVGLLLSYPGVAVLWFACVSVPLTVVFGQTAGQKIFGLFVVRYTGDPAQPLRRPGPLRAIAHVALFVILLPIDWLPWLFGRSRLLHEMIARTQVVSRPPEDEVRIQLRTWLILFGALYFAYTLIVLVARWGEISTTVTVLVLWAIPIATALWVMTAERHPLFLSWSIALVCIVLPILILWAVVAGKMQLSAINTGKLWLVALFVIGFGVRVAYFALKRR